MKYRIVGVEVGELNENNVISALEARGYKCTGVNINSSSRDELQGQPTFAGLAGPMYGGEGVVRYETPEVYEQLSQ